MKPTLWSIVKDNIGKELSRIALPVTINEPLGLT
jgi:oxysterol-binding protein-related protein 3/6/7